MRLEPWSLVVIMVVACGSEPAGQPETPTPAEPSSGQTSEPEPSEPDEGAVAADPTPEEPSVPSLSPDGEVVPLACGRANVRLPAGFTIDQVSGCENGGYPMPINGENFAGGGSRLSLTGRTCEYSVSAREVLEPRAEGIETNDRGVTLTVRTPEGTTFLTSLRQPRQVQDATCTSVAEAVAAVLAQSMSMTPLRDPANRVQAQISSAGHGVTLDLPAGYWLFSLGGEADQYETAYRLMGPTDTSATLITAWDPQADPSAPLRRFQARVLSRRARPAPHDEAWDPVTADPCRRLYAVGPEPRIEAHIDFCGPAAGDAALVQLLLDARFTRPPPEAP